MCKLCITFASLHHSNWSKSPHVELSCGKYFCLQKLRGKHKVHTKYTQNTSIFFLPITTRSTAFIARKHLLHNYTAQLVSCCKIITPHCIVIAGEIYSFTTWNLCFSALPLYSMWSKSKGNLSTPMLTDPCIYNTTASGDFRHRLCIFCSHWNCIKQVNTWCPIPPKQGENDAMLYNRRPELYKMPYMTHTYSINQMLPLYFPPLSRTEQIINFDPNALNSNRLRIWDTGNQENILNILNILPGNRD